MFDIWCSRQSQEIADKKAAQVDHLTVSNSADSFCFILLGLWFVLLEVFSDLISVYNIKACNCTERGGEREERERTKNSIFCSWSITLLCVPFPKLNGKNRLKNRTSNTLLFFVLFFLNACTYVCIERWFSLSSCTIQLACGVLSDSFRFLRQREINVLNVLHSKMYAVEQRRPSICESRWIAHETGWTRRSGWTPPLKRER